MNTKVAAAGLVILALIAGGFTYYAMHSHPHGVSTRPLNIVSPTQSNPSANTVPINPAPREATIYTVDPSHGDANGLAPTKVPVTDPESPARSALESLIGTDNSPLPAGTRLRGVKIDGGTATVDFSSEYQKNFHGGDMQEAQAVNSVLMTLGQFRTIDHVQILVDGSPIDTLGGHFEISSPLDVIRPGSSRQAKNE
jgi:germination protein M